MKHQNRISTKVKVFTGILIIISVAVEFVSGKDERPNYDEFYNSRAAAAIKDIGSGVGDHKHAASSTVLKHVEAEDQVPYEAKQRKQSQVYEIPRETLAKFSLEDAYEDEIDALDREYSSPTVYKLDAVKVSDTKKEDVQDDHSGSGESRENPKSSYKKTKDSKPKKVSVKESSEEDSYVPRYKESRYQVLETKPSAPTEAPYKSYKSYTSKPVASASNDEYHVSPSETIPSNCEEVKEKSDDKEPEMKCVVCKDPKTGFKSRQCSYSSASEPEAYSITKSAKYSQPHKEVNERFKRYVMDDDKDFDPYEHFKAESQKQFSYDERDFFKDFKFPSYYTGDIEKSESEIQAEKLMKDGGVCKEVKRNDMTCKVCKNEKTGGNFETCSYSSVPTEKKYAFVSEKKSDGNSGKSESPRKDSKARETKFVEKKFEPRTSESAKDENKDTRGSAKASDDDSYSIPEHFARETKQLTERSNQYGGREEENKGSHSGDDYYNKIFNSKPAASEEKQSYSSQNNGKDVERVLEEFARKDRSSCKKADRNGMTCYLCVNKDGTQHEECMYVNGKQPQSRHVAYHEVEQVKPKQNPASAASTVREVTVQKRKWPIKKAYSNTQASPSVKVTTTTKFSPSVSSGSIINGKFRQPRKLRRTQNYSGADAVVEETRNNPVITQRKPSVEPIAASSDPKYVHSKELGVSLPRHLLEESEYEKSFKKRS